MNGITIFVLNGLALGLASTLHCAGMCGAVSCSLLLAQERGHAWSPRTVFALTHAGRIAAYSLAGAAIAAIGAPAIVWLDREVAFRLLQWAGAAALIWIGLSTAGLVPSLTLVDRGFASIANRIALANSHAQRRAFTPIVAGLAWGMMPCAMVYAALFAAMLTGSPVAGATTMFAFGIGTLPGLIAASFGFRYLAQLKGRAPTRMFAGLAVAAFGAATVLLAHPHSPYFCLSGSTASAPSMPQAALDRRQAGKKSADLDSAPLPKTQMR
jgi:hypothetical protein